MCIQSKLDYDIFMCCRSMRWTYWSIYEVNPQYRETQVCIISAVATDVLVLKHQAISIHNAD